MAEELYLGIDVRPSTVRVGLGDDKGLASDVFSVDRKEYWSEDGLIELLEDSLRNFNRSLEDVKSIGLAVSGLVNPEEKKMRESYSLEELEFTELKQLDTQFYVENDANAAVIGEKEFGEGQEKENLVTILLDDGIGGGVFYSGWLLGSREDGSSPEPAGIQVSENAIWDEAVGGELMPDYMEDWLESTEEETGLEIGMDAREVLKRSQAGDTSEFINHLAELNARGIATIIDTYAPEKITFTGFVATENPEFMEKTFQKVEEKTINPVPEMKISKEKEKLGVLGAIAIAQGKYLPVAQTD
ncbi:MAG: ROK family protein [Candidatus Nanohalobium sp.]